MNILDHDPIETRECVDCKQIKPISKFRLCEKNKPHLGRRSECRSCENSEKRTIIKIRKQGIPPKPTHCQLCGKETDKLCIDHCHETEQFRGWICSYCNHTLGRLGDNLTNAKKNTDKILEYLSSFENKHIK